jgi:hypothetical protein
MEPVQIAMAEAAIVTARERRRVMESSLVPMKIGL